MPRMDGTGPIGKGPIGGRCIRYGGYGRNRAMLYGLGCMAGAGLGLLRNRRLGGRFPEGGISDAELKEALQDEKEILEQRLKEINDRMQES